jgi:hypothetical protein
MVKSLVRFLCFLGKTTKKKVKSSLVNHFIMKGRHIIAGRLGAEFRAGSTQRHEFRP